MAQRITAQRTTDGKQVEDTKKTLHPAKYLPYPKITSPEEAQRAQRHVPNSITSLRMKLWQKWIERMRE